MVGGAQQRVLEIDQLAFHVDRKDLAVAVGDDLVPRGIARKQNGAMIRAIEFADDVAALLHRLDGVREREDRGPVVGIERTPIFELAEHRLQP